MRIAIANGFLTNEQEFSPLGYPVFVLNDVVYGPDDKVDSGGSAPASGGAQPARDLIAEEYEIAAENGGKFSILEYNLIARFSGMPPVNLCSGE